MKASVSPQIAKALTVGQVAQRAGVSVATLRFLRIQGFDRELAQLWKSAPLQSRSLAPHRRYPRGPRTGRPLESIKVGSYRPCHGNMPPPPKTEESYRNDGAPTLPTGSSVSPVSRDQLMDASAAFTCRLSTCAPSQIPGHPREARPSPTSRPRLKILCVPRKASCHPERSEGSHISKSNRKRVRAFA